MNTKILIAAAILLLAATLPLVPQRGNIDYDQIRSAARQGNGSKFLMFAGTSPTSGHMATFDASGNAQDGGSPGGNTNQNIRSLGATFVNGGSALSGSTTTCGYLPYAGTIQQVSLIGDQSGSATVDVKTVAYGSYTGPSSASSITAADTPALSSAAKYKDSTLTGWTAGLSADTIVCFALSAPSTVTTVEIVLKIAAN